MQSEVKRHVRSFNWRVRLSISIGQVSGFLVICYAYFEEKNQEKSLDDEVDPKSSFKVLAPIGLYQTKWKKTPFPSLSALNSCLTIRVWKKFT